MATLNVRTVTLGLLLGVSSMSGCSTSAGRQGLDSPADGSGIVSLRLQVAPGVSIDQIDWTISNPTLLAADRTGTVDVSQSATIQFVVGGLPAGGGYTITLRATTSTGVGCVGSALFTVAPGATASVMAGLVCGATSVDAGGNGSVAVSTPVSIAMCAAVSALSASPSSVAVGGAISLSAQGVDSSGSSSDVSFSWLTTAGPGNGAFSSTTSASPTFTCTAAGPVTLTVAASVLDASTALCTNDTASVSLTCTQCSGPTPPDFGQGCGSCGGTAQCGGSCSVPTPGDLGTGCGSCGGTVRCDGSCSIATPLGYGTHCGPCVGTVQCDGSCSPAPPMEYLTTCGCSGQVTCDGSCSNPFPMEYGQPCGPPFFSSACLDKLAFGQGQNGLPFPTAQQTCNLTCQACESIGAIIDPGNFTYGNDPFAGVQSFDASGNANVVVGGDCQPGFGPDGCIVVQQAGSGHCEVAEQAYNYVENSGPGGLVPASCRCLIHWGVSGVGSGSCTWEITEAPLVDAQ